MRASLLARAGSVAAATVVALTGAMATAGAAGAATTPARRLPTHLIVAKVLVVRHNRHVAVIVGDLRSHRVPLRDKVVDLDRRTARGRWIVVGREVTHRFGSVAFAVAPRVDAQYVLVFKGSPNFSPSRSRVVTVKAKG
jgi:hypothetical protein